MKATTLTAPADPCDVIDRKLSEAEHDAWLAEIRARPMTHEQINGRMQKIQQTLSAYWLGSFRAHRNAKTLEAELDYWRSVYDGVLTGRRTHP